MFLVGEACYTGILIFVAIGIDGDPFDELWACLRIMWFIPIFLVGLGIYAAMYQKLPPGVWEAYTVANQYKTQFMQHIAAKPAVSKEKKED